MGGRANHYFEPRLRGSGLALRPLRLRSSVDSPGRRRDRPSAEFQGHSRALSPRTQRQPHSIRRLHTLSGAQRTTELPSAGGDPHQSINDAYPFYASEGWILTDGRRGFLLTKYSQQGMEWALLDRVRVSDGRDGVRWGGFGIFQGDPEHGAWLAPQQSHRFGITRITAYEGGINEGFYTFRGEMETRGHGCPKGFNPPVHWNELYDNKLWWLPGGGMDLPENRKKYYTLADMKEEAAKARDMGCEALYLDPGWDTRFASKIWDESRLGKLKDFTAMLRQEYGLSLSLHTPLSGWCDPSSYARSIDRMNRDGSRVEKSLCGASAAVR